jgi:uncharacterized protein (TIGR03435 family)
MLPLEILGEMDYSRQMRRICPLILFSATLLFAQAQPSFEVASVRSQPWEGNGRVGVFIHGDTLSAEHTCLYGLVEFAYALRDEHLSGGPAWARCGVLASSDLYQVIAKAAGDPPPPTGQFRLMLQALLADRFQLRVHHVQKELPIYNLAVSPKGSKLKASADDTPFSLHVDARVNHGNSVRMTARHVSIAKLLLQFEFYAKRPVMDQTALTAFYDFEMAWDLDTSTVPQATDSEWIGQSFEVALERQLGLKLVTGTASFDTIVIDHAEKPSQN